MSDVTDAATEANRKHWDTRAALINAQIKAGAFDYRAWFPNGTKISLPARVDLQDGAFVTGDMLWDVYYLWFHTGWRSNEIMAIEFDALSWHRQVVEIRKGRSPRHGGLEAAPKTGEREVVCGYDPMLFTIFERRRRESLATGHRQYVFSDSRGRPLSQEWLAKRVWHPTLRQIGVGARGQYNIRDTFISLALSAGEDPGWVAQVCGTSEQMIFRHYRTWMPSLRRGRGRLLAQTLEIGPKIGPKGGVRGPSVRKIKDLRSGGGGNRTPMGDHSREEEVSPTRVSAI